MTLATIFAGIGWAHSRKRECLAWYNKTGCGTMNPRRRCRHDVAAPRVAFLIAGDARSFAEPGVAESYQRFVVGSFRAHNASRVFLVLKNGEGVDMQRVRTTLAPAAVLLEDAADAKRRTLALREPWCHRAWMRTNRGTRTSFVPWETVNWWYASSLVTAPSTVHLMLSSLAAMPHTCCTPPARASTPAAHLEC